MPVHDLGYRGWNYRKTAKILRPVHVALSGIALVWGRRWLRFMLLLSWLPVVIPAGGLFAFEFSSTNEDVRDAVFGILSGPLGQPELAVEASMDPDSARHQVWSNLIRVFFRYPQLSAMVLLVGLIAPMLVSYDLRSKAYLLYFSRPLTTTEYIVGKSAVVWFFLSMIVTIPALILYVAGVMLSPNLSVVVDTWDIIPRILLASFVLLVPTTALAMCYSSCTSESRYATFAWFATWILGYVAYYFLTFATLVATQGEMGRRPVNPQDIDLDQWHLLSPFHTLGKVQNWVFDPGSTTGSVYPALTLLVIVTIVGFAIVRNRINSKLSI